MRKHIELALIAFLGLSTIFPVVVAAATANAAAAVSAATLFDYNSSLSREDFAKTVIMEIGQERFFIGGHEASSDKPFVEQGRTMVPLRTVAQAFGAKVDWSAPNKEVTVTLNNLKVDLRVGSKNIQVNGVERELDVAAEAFSGRTYLPLRAIGEALGKSVSYANAYKLIFIADKQAFIKKYADGHRYLALFAWAIEGKGNKVFYGDHNLLVYYKDDGSMVLHDWSGGESPFASYHPYPGTPGSPFHWFTVSDTKYLVFHVDAEVGEDSIYQYRDGTLKLIYSNPIFDIKFTSTAMYILVNGPGVDPWPRVDEHSNLLKVNLQDNTQEYLGVKGYIYGVNEQQTPEGAIAVVRDNWKVADDGVYISGYYYLGTSEEKNTTTGQYKINVTGQSHEKLAP
ncbi:copper amine oxidase N-terminal domain-containing protein [Paenibacillus sp. CF384]|uniref:copper amine oxidase N-terminal domain-containing protein n=1 Tax=Paenibacillus sp. CF384 TaxID=1884382 RepID=UPI000896BB71|nr:copper amine oxidase N-terminal domain-containing protein [Paenibacillus sp. CF384]SDX98263.1 Copper amine oxidase N-terminal domain-containing protein [Paenibacillus sp. CF384]